MQQNTRGLKISETKDYFTRDGRKFFYLGDTMWTAFYNPSIEEWDEYLEYRKTQNFNAVGINILQQWDGGKPDQDIYPFRVDSRGRFDFQHLNEPYFERAKTLLERAVHHGFVPSLGVLHGSYVPGTWATKGHPDWVMPLEVVRSYSAYVAETFAPYNPVFSIGGDNDFESELTTKHYLEAFKAVRKANPHALITFCTTPSTILPEVFAGSEYLDFYTYQSGHRIEEQHYTYALAEGFYQRPVKRPIVSGEFNYEGHGYGHANYGRYNEFHVRRAAWQSILAGAKAGLMYGAHGLWGWYRRGKEFANEAFAGPAFPWQVALRFKGAWDVSFARWLFETYDLFELEPSDAVLNKSEQQRREIRMAMSRTQDRVVLYIPYSVPVEVGIDLGDYDCYLVNLSEKLFARPLLKPGKDGSVIRMHDFNSDALFIGVKR